MSYKTILVHIDESQSLDVTVAIACKLAEMESAHLIGSTVTGVSRFLYQVAEGNPQDPVVGPHLEAMRQRANASLQRFETKARQFDIKSLETRHVDDDAAGGLTLQAPYCDLVVLGQYDPEVFPSSVLGQDLPAHIVMNTHCPILLVPYAGSFSTVGDRVLVAWNGSPEATRAVRDAIPLLKRAKIVEVVLFNPQSQPDAFSPEPGADIALYLARHGIEVNVTLQTTEIDIGNALLSLASDLNSDLLVMGCYGRSRFREMMLGGASRTILQDATIPVFMSH